MRAANERVVASLGAGREALTQTERERFVAQALSRLSAEATAEQRREVGHLAGTLFDEPRPPSRPDTWPRLPRDELAVADRDGCFAAIDLVAAAGLWLRTWWGGMAFLAAAVAHIVMYTFCFAIFGNHPGLVGFHLATIAIWGFSN